LSIRFTAQAEEDLVTIFGYTQHEWGELQARRYLTGLYDTFRLIERMPTMGRVCNDIRIGMRRLPKARHIIFYMISEKESLLIVRILHENMSAGEHDFLAAH
jgi:toxin ParE1/3/4